MDWREECRRVHDEGLQKLVQDGCIPFRLRPYNNAGKSPLHDLIFEDGIGDGGRQALKSIAILTFSKIHLPAALIQSDAMMVDMPKFIKYFGLSSDLSPFAVQDEYSRILAERFDGTAENLPQELWTDIIFTYIKGPQIMATGFQTAYQKDAEGRVKFKLTGEVPEALSNILPDWWENTIN
jgi:hypothetical protein